ncbi:MAG: transporter substrate-binding domain-containing protein [Pseudomonadota bacterium]
MIRLWPNWLTTLFFVFCGSAVLAQELRVVTVTRTPFSQIENGEETGFSLDLWAEIAAQLDRPYQIERLDSFPDMLTAIENGTADIAAANISITADRESRFDFSQPIFSSGLRIMIPAGQSSSSVFSAIWNRDFLFAALAALGLLLGGGLLMWVFERKGGQEYFQGSAREKAFPAFWWALNLVVNGGFEERVPRSPLGRFFATVLVISSLFIVSVFVAHITAAMTVNAIQSSVQSVNDLYGKRVGTIGGSTAAAFLEDRDITLQAFSDLERLLDAFENGQIEAVVFDAPILSYYVTTTQAGTAELVGPVFLRENYGLALQQGSGLREPINRILLRLREDGTYDDLYRRWFGSDVVR